MKQGIPMITAVVMAGDFMSAEQATRQLQQGGNPLELYKRIGSYARFEWAFQHLPKADLLRLLPELWISADPDDSKGSYLALWQEAYRANGNRIITDGEPLPFSAKVKMIAVLRGQVGGNLGISWTLDAAVANKFALTGGGRAPVAGGEIFTGIVKQSDILAYLTERNESELIIDPKQVMLVGKAEPERIQRRSKLAK
jgi:hypothetical protein